VSVSATVRLGKKLSTVARTSKTASTSGRLTLTFKVSKAALKVLAKHNLAVTVKITSTPERGTASSRTKHLIFKRLKHH
jgi:hypothetical protein